jgi:hypothetical protein
MTTNPQPTSAPQQQNPLTVAGYLLERLAALEVRHIFGVPGDYNLALLDVIEAHPTLEWIGTANELNAAYAADGSPSACPSCTLPVFPPAKSSAGGFPCTTACSTATRATSIAPIKKSRAPTLKSLPTTPLQRSTEYSPRWTPRSDPATSACRRISSARR